MVNFRNFSPEIKHDLMIGVEEQLHTYSNAKKSPLVTTMSTTVK